MRPAGLSVALWAALAAAPALASDAQYRTLTLVDGRILTAEVVATEPQGLLLEMPQGRAVVEFEMLRDMSPTTKEAYQSQDDWVVWVQVPVVYQDRVEEMLDEMPGIDGALAGYGGGVSGGATADVVACESDIECIARAAADTPWKWIITGRLDGAGRLELFSRTNTRENLPVHRVSLDKTERQDFWFALHELLRLKVPELGPPEVEQDSTILDGPTRTRMSARRVTALSFLPVPGLPSLLQKDYQGFGTSLGIVVPSTAVWVSAVGYSEPSAAEFGLLSFAGYYTATVLTNQVMGMRSLRKSQPVVGIVPSSRGTPTVMMATEF